MLPTQPPPPKNDDDTCRIGENGCFMLVITQGNKIGQEILNAHREQVMVSGHPFCIAKASKNNGMSDLRVCWDQIPVILIVSPKDQVEHYQDRYHMRIPGRLLMTAGNGAFRQHLTEKVSTEQMFELAIKIREVERANHLNDAQIVTLGYIHGMEVFWPAPPEAVSR